MPFKYDVRTKWSIERQRHSLNNGKVGLLNTDLFVLSAALTPLKDTRID